MTYAPGTRVELVQEDSLLDLFIPFAIFKMMGIGKYATIVKKNWRTYTVRYGDGSTGKVKPKDIRGPVV